MSVVAKHGIAVALTSLLATNLTAQTGQRTGAVVGTVRSAPDSLVVNGATVFLIGAGARVVTRDSGTFRLEGIAPGPHRLQAQKLGYVAATRVVDVKQDSATVIEFWLSPITIELAEIQVRGQRVTIPRRLLPAYERTRNHGALFTAAEIRERNPLDTRSLLERLPGVRVHDWGITFARCSNNPQTQDATGGRVQVYVDGNRLTGMAGDQYGNKEHADAILRTIHPLSIELMEVYTGVARIPAEFLADACAVIAIWTKSY